MSGEISLAPVARHGAVSCEPEDADSRATASIVDCAVFDGGSGDGYYG
jgi:hypothetical protein